MPFDKHAVDRALETFSSPGVSGNPETTLVVSLTSYPARMGTLHYALYTLLNQTLKPDAVILWLAEEEFPGGERDLPEKVLSLRRNGLGIRWTRNLRSYKKLVPALGAFPESVIATADDDFLYEADWLERLYADYERNERQVMVYAHRAHTISLSDKGHLLSYRTWDHAAWNTPGVSFLNFATGGGGSLYPPGALHPEVRNEDLFLELAPHADDVWFWAMAVLNGTRTRVVENFLALPTHLETGSGGLYAHNVGQGGNDAQLARVLSRFPEIAVNIMVEQAVLRRSRGAS